MLKVVVAAELWQRTVSAGLTPELLQCPTCHTVHANTGQYAVCRHTKHVCARCGNVFSISSQLACVGNLLASLPMLKRIDGKLSVDGRPSGDFSAVGGPSSCLVSSA